MFQRILLSSERNGNTVPNNWWHALKVRVFGGTEIGSKSHLRVDKKIKKEEYFWKESRSALLITYFHPICCTKKVGQMQCDFYDTSKNHISVPNRHLFMIFFGSNCQSMCIRCVIACFTRMLISILMFRLLSGRSFSLLLLQMNWEIGPNLS